MKAWAIHVEPDGLEICLAIMRKVKLEQPESENWKNRAGLLPQVQADIQLNADLWAPRQLSFGAEQRKCIFHTMRLDVK